MKCCERDTDGDGNCPIHSAPGILRPPIGFTCSVMSEDQFVERLKTAGWKESEARQEYDQMLRDAAEEDGMD